MPGMAVRLMDIVPTIASKEDLAYPPQITLTHRQNLKQSPTDCSMAPRNAMTMATMEDMAARLLARGFESCGKSDCRERQQEELWLGYYCCRHVKKYWTRHGLHYHSLLARN